MLHDFQKNHYLKKIQAIICLDMMAGGHAPSDDNLQAQLDALEAGLLPLSGSHSGGHGSGFGEGNDFQVGVSTMAAQSVPFPPSKRC